MLPSLYETVQGAGLLAKKSLGQNFLLNQEITQRIVQKSGIREGDQVLEVGPGPGGLTRALLEKGAIVTAIEMDERCFPILEELSQHYPGKLRIIQGDALEHKPQDLFPEGGFHIAANLPYNIGTILLIDWLHNLDRLKSMTLMFQKEVAQRICARPDTSAYGRLSILAQWLCSTERVMELSPKCFTPAPKVASTVVHLKPQIIPSEDLPLIQKLGALTHAAFSQRRKMIRSSLKTFFSSEKLESLGFNPMARAETLPVEAFIVLARNLT